MNNIKELESRIKAIIKPYGERLDYGNIRLAPSTLDENTSDLWFSLGFESYLGSTDGIAFIYNLKTKEILFFGSNNKEDKTYSLEDGLVELEREVLSIPLRRIYKTMKFLEKQGKKNREKSFEELLFGFLRNGDKTERDFYTQKELNILKNIFESYY